jgi:hypothetical protein
MLAVKVTKVKKITKLAMNRKSLILCIKKSNFSFVMHILKKKATIVRGSILFHWLGSGVDPPGGTPGHKFPFVSKKLKKTYMYQVEQPPGRLLDISALVHCFPGRWKHLSRIYPVAAPREGFVQRNSARKGLKSYLPLIVQTKAYLSVLD